MRMLKLVCGAGLIVVLTAFFYSCGGGGGGGSSDFGYAGTGFGFSNLFGNTTGRGTALDLPILDGVNLPVMLFFNEDIDPATVNENSIDVSTIYVPDNQDPNDHQ